MISITITINDPDAARVSEAFGKQLGLASPASDAEIHGAIASYIQQVTLNQEQVALVEAAQDAGAHIVPVVVE
jgi:hypothetical protein